MFYVNPPVKELGKILRDAKNAGTEQVVILKYEVSTPYKDVLAEKLGLLSCRYNVSSSTISGEFPPALTSLEVLAVGEEQIRDAFAFDAWYNISIEAATAYTIVQRSSSQDSMKSRTERCPLGRKKKYSRKSEFLPIDRTIAVEYLSQGIQPLAPSSCPVKTFMVI